MYVYLCFSLCLYCLLSLCLKIKYENKQTNFYIDSFILCLPFLQILAFCFVHWSTLLLQSHQPEIMDIFNVVSFMFLVSFFLASTNMLGSLCYKYIIMLISQGVMKNKLHNSYKFLTWHSRHSTDGDSVPFSFVNTHTQYSSGGNWKFCWQFLNIEHNFNQL